MSDPQSVAVFSSIFALTSPLRILPQISSGNAVFPFTAGMEVEVDRPPPPTSVSKSAGVPAIAGPNPGVFPFASALLSSIRCASRKC